MEERWRRSNADGKDQPTVLLVSPRERDQVRLRLILDRLCWKLYTATSILEAMAILLDRSIPVVICECRVLGGDWKALWELLRFLSDRPNLIVSSPQADKRLWDEVLSLGGYAVLPTPFDAGVVLQAVRLARFNWLRQMDGILGHRGDSGCAVSGRSGGRSGPAPGPAGSRQEGLDRARLPSWLPSPEGASS